MSISRAELSQLSQQLESNRWTSKLMVGTMSADKIDDILFTISFYKNKSSAAVRRYIERAINKALKYYREDMEEIPMKEDEKSGSSHEISTKTDVYLDYIIEKTGTDSEFGSKSDLPEYCQQFSAILSDEFGDTIPINFKRKKCFNCDSTEHEIQTCPKPRCEKRIMESRKQIADQQRMSFNSNTRYHAGDVDSKFSEFYPGVISSNLRAALQIGPNDIPMYIYKMRLLGYPPGFAIKHRMESNLVFYSQDGTSALEPITNEDKSIKNDSDVYLLDSRDDVKVINSIEKYKSLTDRHVVADDERMFFRFEGFNALPSEGTLDNGSSYGFPVLNPLQLLPSEYEKFVKNLEFPSTTEDDVLVVENDFMKGDKKMDEEELMIPINSVTSNFDVRTREWWLRPLPTDIFLPKRRWKCPPKLESVPTIDEFIQGKYSQIDTAPSIFGEEMMPTDNLERIEQFLKKMKQNRRRK